MNTHAEQLNIDDEDAFMKATGQDTDSGSSAKDYPILKVNYNNTNSDGEPIPKGYWTWNYDGQPVYAEEVDMQILFVRKQYSHYDPIKNERVSTSVYFNTFDEEIPDDIGSLKCGKVSKEELTKVSDIEKARQKQIKLNQVVFGRLFATAKNADGDTVNVKDYPVVYYAKTSSYVPMADYLDSLVKSGKLMMNVLTRFKLDKKKRGAIEYWIVHPTVLSEVESAFEEQKERIYDIMEKINSRNVEILDKWATVRAGDAPFDNDDLEDDFKEGA